MMGMGEDKNLRDEKKSCFFLLTGGQGARAFISEMSGLQTRTHPVAVQAMLKQAD